MMSSADQRQKRKAPEQRRSEIVEAAADLALDEGLERITLRSVSERLGVRPSLIGHYFPVAEALVIEAFGLAIAREREALFPPGGTPLQRVATMIARSQSDESRALAQLWLNARHLSRSHPELARSLAAQEELDRDRLIAVIDDGIRAGEFHTTDAVAAAVRIFVAVDGVGAYVNDIGTFSEESFSNFVADTAEWALALTPGRMREAAAAATAKI